jgi:hypothetical protein
MRRGRLLLVPAGLVLLAALAGGGWAARLAAVAQEAGRQCGQCGWHCDRDRGSVSIKRPCLWLLTSVVRYGRVLIVM